MGNQVKGMNLYFTKRVKKEVGIPIAFSIIECVKSMQVERDALQIFTLDVLSEHLIAINHSQEKPAWSMTYYLEATSKYNSELTGRKLYLVFEITHATLMLAEEY